MHTEVPAGLVDVVKMDKSSVTLGAHLRKSDRESEKTQPELNFASSAVLKAQHLALNKAKEACLYRQQLKCLEKQSYLAHEEVKSLKAESAGATV